MSLGLKSETTGGAFLPIVKYDARAGRLFRVDRSLDGTGSWVSTDVDITSGAKFAMDLPHIETGWISFASGPDFRMAPLGTKLPDRPSKEFKQGFRVKLFAPKLLSGVREWSHTGKCVIAAMNALHDEFLGALEAKAGKVPLVALTGTRPVTTQTPQGKSTNYGPIFTIERWLDRPPEFDAKPATPPQQSPPPVDEFAQASAAKAAPAQQAAAPGQDF